MPHFPPFPPSSRKRPRREATPGSLLAVFTESAIRHPAEASHEEQPTARNEPWAPRRRASASQGQLPQPVAVATSSSSAATSVLESLDAMSPHRRPDPKMFHKPNPSMARLEPPSMTVTHSTQRQFHQPLSVSESSTLRRSAVESFPVRAEVAGGWKEPPPHDDSRKPADSKRMWHQNQRQPGRKDAMAAQKISHRFKGIATTSQSSSRKEYLEKKHQRHPTTAVPPRIADRTQSLSLPATSVLERNTHPKALAQQHKSRDDLLQSLASERVTKDFGTTRSSDTNGDSDTDSSFSSSTSASSKLSTSSSDSSVGRPRQNQRPKPTKPALESQSSYNSHQKDETRTTKRPAEEEDESVHRADFGNDDEYFLQDTTTGWDAHSDLLTPPSTMYNTKFYDNATGDDLLTPCVIQYTLAVMQEQATRAVTALQSSSSIDSLARSMTLRSHCRTLTRRVHQRLRQQVLPDVYIRTDTNFGLDIDNSLQRHTDRLLEQAAELQEMEQSLKAKQRRWEEQALEAQEVTDALQWELEDLQKQKQAECHGRLAQFLSIKEKNGEADESIELSESSLTRSAAPGAMALFMKEWTQRSERRLMDIDASIFRMRDLKFGGCTA